MYLFRALAQEGEKAAFREIGNIYEYGDGGVDKSIQKAKEWYLRAANEANDAYGCLGLARIYYYGKDGAPDYQAALHYLLTIENNELPRANLMLGRIYGLGRGTKRDYEKARMYYRKAMGAGNLIAQKDLGLLEWEEKNYLSGLVLWVTAAAKIVLAALKNRHDKRLQR